MNTGLTREEVQDYLKAHQDTPLDKFVFKGSPFTDISIQELAQQLDGKRRMKHKLPLWYRTPGILFPPKLNLEQTSSAFTAQYKAGIVKGSNLLDMTGGFGIDSYYFAQQIKEVHHVELNKEVAAFAKANFETLQLHNIQTHTGDAVAYLQGQNRRFDTIYLDPARRNDSQGKVFKLNDCTPNVIEHLDFLLSKANQVLVKTSPLLDISAGLSELKQVNEIHIVALNNEVKEVLWSIQSNVVKDVTVITINKRRETIERTSTTLTKIAEAKASYSEPMKYLYEPNAALMKSGAFAWLSEEYAIAKLHPHSHLYASVDCIAFPGRVFQIVEVLPFDKQLKKRLKLKKGNITTRNFKLSVTKLRKTLGIKDGGEDYLFFTTDLNDKQIVIICRKA